jgi:hypothetical protein
MVKSRGILRIFVVMCYKFSRDFYTGYRDAENACGKLVNLVQLTGLILERKFVVILVIRF